MRIKRMCCLAMAAAMTCGMVSCGAKKPKGLYYCLIAGNADKKDYVDDLDDALKDYADDNADYYRIEFDGDEAEIYEKQSAYEFTYLAEYKIDEKTGKFIFDYQSLKRETKDETIKVKVGDEGETPREKLFIDSLEELNDTEGLPRYSITWLAATDKIRDYSLLPQFILGGYVTSVKDGIPATLYNKGDVLCTDVYGLELDGKYKPGKEFTLEFDQYQACEDCPLFTVQEETIIEGMSFGTKTIITSRYHSDKTDSTIEFEDGEWTWYNHEGDILNDGEYVESEDYEGLIAMYLTDKSKNTGGGLSYHCINNPLFLYLSDDGEVYYPVFVKEK